MSDTPTLTPIVSLYDTAIDYAKTGTAAMRKYAVEREFSTLVFKPGMAPAIYHIREVPHHLWGRYIAGSGSPEEKAWRCFQATVMEVEDIRQRDGTRLPGRTPMLRIPGTEVMEDAALDRCIPFFIEEIGEVARRKSFYPKEIADVLPMPPTWLEALEAATSLIAAASPSAPATNSGEASSMSEATPEMSATTG